MKTERQPRKPKTPNLNPMASSPRLRLACCGLLAALALPLGLTPRAYANITVTSLADSGPGSLRQAIADAAPGDTIDFATNGTITLTSGELVITNDLIIAGPGAANLTISGNNASRVFHLTAGNALISGLTIADAHSSDPRPGAESSGGGIRNEATLSLSACVIRNCSAYGSGGGVDNRGTLSLARCTIFGCFAGPGVGGGIHSSGTLFATNSTLSGNSTASGGGGLFVPGTAVLRSCTIASNMVYSRGLGGGIYLWAGGSVRLQNTVVFGNRESDFFEKGGTLISDDYNLFGGTNYVNITGDTTHNLYGVDPLLGPLADNGGPTPTHALRWDSPAIDAGSSGGLTTDQRGRIRPVLFASHPVPGDGSDIGAFELQGRSVTTLDDSGPGSLRQAIADAAPGDTIDFATNGTITLTSGELVITNDLIIAGPGAANLTISGNNASRVFRLGAGNSTISGVTVADGRTDGQGGGIALEGGFLDLRFCVIASNYAKGFSGWGGGGMVSLSGSSLRVSGCHFIGNTNNHPGGEGGGLLVLGGRGVVVDSTFSANVSEFGGGLAVLFSNSEAAVTNCTFSGNWARGGAVLNLDSKLTLSSCTVCSNLITEGSREGGVRTIASYNRLTMTFLAGDLLAGNAGGDVGTGPNLTTSLDYNFIQNTNGAVLLGDTSHNLYGLDPLLGPLADNGGPTPTHALRWDSPAIDAGGAEGPVADQRGVARPVVGTAAGIAAFDIGAYEFVPVAPVITSQPITQTISPNGSVVFTVGDTGNPPPAYQWYFGGSAIPDATGPTLTLTNVGPAQVGCYSVTLTNFMGGFVSQSACLWLNTLKMYAGVNVYGPIGGNCTIQYTTDLGTDPVQWTTLTNVTIQTMPQVFIDYDSADQPKRFYRTVPQ